MFKRIVGSPWAGAGFGTVSALLGGLSWAGLGFPDQDQDRVVWLSIWFLFSIVGFAWALVAQAFKLNELRDRLKPRLQMVFGSGSPYERDKATYNPKSGMPTGGVLRIFAVGVTNSGDSVGDVSVKLLRIDPPACEERWGLSLRVMDSVGSQPTATVHRSLNAPLVYYELITQRLPRWNEPTSSTTLRLDASTLFDKVALPDRAKHVITLAISGPSAEGEKRFALVKNGNGQYDMKEDRPF